MIIEFPPVETADEDGLLAVGGDLEVGSILLAYKNGIFPWPINKKILAWFSPPRRAVLNFEKLHISRSLERALSRSTLTIGYDRNFKEVIKACAVRSKKVGTWITPELIEAYTALHQAGFAHSVECYRDDVLVGGVYGVGIGRFFAAESMFYREENASKIALVHLVRKLQAQGGSWIDVQVINKFTETLGATEIPRDEFLARAKSEMAKGAYVF